MILSIIIPVYNEEKTVLKSLQSLKDLNKNLFQHEVIVVNDGSQDSTSKILNENKNLYDKLLTNETNRCVVSMYMCILITCITLFT